MLSQKDIISLIDLQAPHSAIGVYTCLLAYSLDSDSCFPSIESICKWLKNSISKRSVYRALNWLVENNFILRKDKRSKDRFVIKSRVTSNVTRRKEENNNCNNNNIFINNTILVPTHDTIKDNNDSEKIINSYLLNKEPLSENQLNKVRSYLKYNESYQNWLIVFHYQVYKDIMKEELSELQRKDIENKWNMEIEEDYLQLFDRGNKNENQNCEEKRTTNRIVRELQSRIGFDKR